MTPANYKIKDHHKGDTFEGVQFTLLNSSDSSPVDLTGASIRIQFRARAKNGSLKQELTSADGITITDAVNGVFKIDSFLIDWRPQIYYYDVQITFPTSLIKTYIQGTLKVIQDTTA